MRYDEPEDIFTRRRIVVVSCYGENPVLLAGILKKKKRRKRNSVYKTTSFYYCMLICLKRLVRPLRKPFFPNSQVKKVNYEQSRFSSTHPTSNLLVLITLITVILFGIVIQRQIKLVGKQQQHYHNIYLPRHP